MAGLYPGGLRRAQSADRPVPRLRLELRTASQIRLSTLYLAILPNSPMGSSSVEDASLPRAPPAQTEPPAPVRATAPREVGGPRPASRRSSRPCRRAGGCGSAGTATTWWGCRLRRTRPRSAGPVRGRPNSSPCRSPGGHRAPDQHSERLRSAPGAHLLDHPSRPGARRRGRTLSAEQCQALLSRQRTRGQGAGLVLATSRSRPPKKSPSVT